MMTGVLWDSLCMDFVVLFYFLLKYFQVVVAESTVVHSDVYVDVLFCVMVPFLFFLFFGICYTVLKAHFLLLHLQFPFLSFLFYF